MPGERRTKANRWRKSYRPRRGESTAKHCFRLMWRRVAHQDPLSCQLLRDVTPRYRWIFGIESGIAGMFRPLGLPHDKVTAASKKDPGLFPAIQSLSRVDPHKGAF
jgi:hypothetical protein